MLGDNDSINWNIRDDVLEPSSSGDGDACSISSDSRSRAPKPRSVFTLKATNVLSKENVEQLQSFERLLSNQPEEHLTQDFSSSDDASSVCSASTQKLVNRKSHHGSMDNLFKPKNHRSTSSHSNSRGDGDKEMIARLTEENLVLISDVERNRKKSLAFKTSAALTFGAFREQRKKLVEMTQLKDKKAKEAAARMILHNLLLNSWRNCKAALNTLLDDNAQLNKTMENLKMQLRVVRHIQSLDKEKFSEKSSEVDKLKIELKRLKDENAQKVNSMDKIEGELNALQGKIQNLEDLNRLYEEDSVMLKETIKLLEQSIESEKEKSRVLERKNSSLKADRRKSEEQLSDLMRQNKSWQERARIFESESWGMKMDLECKEMQLNDARKARDNIQNDNTELAKINEGLKGELDQAANNLELSNITSEDLTKKMGQLKHELKGQKDRVCELQGTLLNVQNDYTRIERELLSYKVGNVRRRREWANALYFIVNPWDALRRSLAMSPTRRHINRHSI